eukprot:52295_1
MWLYIFLLSVGALLYFLLLWWRQSYDAYEPNRGLKFQPPPTYLYPFRHKWLSFDVNSETMESVDDPQDTGLPCVHYIDEGSDKQKDKNDICFLMCHGNGSWSFLYRKMIQTISKKYRCTAIDYPGFGLSTAPKDYTFSTRQQAKILIKVIETLNLNNIILVQQDWGGPTGFYAALHTQARIKGFVIGNTWCWRWNMMQRPGGYIFSALFGGFIGRSLGYGLNFGTRYFFRHGFYKKVTKEIRYWYDIPFKKRNSRKGIWTWPAQILDAKPLLREIEQGIPQKYGKTTPCLFCWASHDIAFKQCDLDKFKSIFIRHKVIHLEESGHFWQEDQGDEAAEYILKWVKDTYHHNGN